MKPNRINLELHPANPTKPTGLKKSEWTTQDDAIAPFTVDYQFPPYGQQETESFKELSRAIRFAQALRLESEAWAVVEDAMGAIIWEGEIDWRSQVEAHIAHKHPQQAK